jgi:hypothetical protein
MLKLALLTATMLALSAASLIAMSSAASARHVRAHHHYWGETNAYGYGGTSALGRYCPTGQYPHSWPGGWRCQYANGDFSGAGRW